MGLVMEAWLSSDAREIVVRRMDSGSVQRRLWHACTGLPNGKQRTCGKAQRRLRTMEVLPRSPSFLLLLLLNSHMKRPGDLIASPSLLLVISSQVVFPFSCQSGAVFASCQFSESERLVGRCAEEGR